MQPPVQSHSSGQRAHHLQPSSPKGEFLYEIEYCIKIQHTQPVDLKPPSCVLLKLDSWKVSSEVDPCTRQN